MKLTVEFIETAQGNVEAHLRMEGTAKGTLKEQAFGQATYNLVKTAIPLLGEKMGAKTAFMTNAKPENS